MLGVPGQAQREETRRYLAETRPRVVARAATAYFVEDDAEAYEGQVDRLDVVELTLLEIERRQREDRIAAEQQAQWMPNFW